MKRRTILKLLATALPALKSTSVLAKLQATARTEGGIAPGPFQATRESLEAYEIPQWFQDAKFGIWAHWGPQSAAEAGDWYARNMYIQTEWQYKRHLEQYGHPSKFGF